MAEKAVSLNDVARSAEVSVSTVSRYLNGQLALSDVTESRILDAIERTGYERAPRRSRSEAGSPPRSVIGLVIPQVDNSYYGAIAEAAVSAAEAHGIHVVVVSTLNHSRKQLDYVELLTAIGVSGILYVGSYRSNSALADVVTSGLPVVVVDEQLSGMPPVDTVLVDDYAGAYQATTYLLSLGHRSIGVLTGPEGLGSVSERRRGWRDALLRYDVDPDEQFSASGAFSDDFGAAALSHLLADPHTPTAVFAASDIIALGLLGAARRLGVSVPGELSVVGFDDLPASSLVTPRLTTVRTPVQTMAETAVSLLVDRLHGVQDAPRTSITSVSLIVGDSTAVVLPASAVNA